MCIFKSIERITDRSVLNLSDLGSNPGCNTNGFPVRAGWDPVSFSLFVCSPS